MSIEVRVPTLPESVADATLVTWHKQPGDAVSRDENLVDLETDKVMLEIPAPSDGVLSEILQADGATVTAGDVIATIEEAGASAAKTDAKPQQREPEPTASETAGRAEVDPQSLSPAVRRLVQEHQLDPAQISASGRNGRLTKSDVVEHLKQREQSGSATTEAAPQPAAPQPAAPQPVAPQPAAPQPAAPRPAAPQPAAPQPADPAGRIEQRVPMTRLRARIAERLVQAQQTAAILTTFNEVDMQPVMDLRRRYKDRFEKAHDAKLGFMSFFVKASVEALKRFPAVNGSIDGGDIIYHGYYDIGIAVSSPRGLVVPILRDADQMSFAEVEKTIGDYGQRARDGALSMDELTGGTFSITNGGIFGSLMSTPILNPPQSAILGMHKIMERPMAENGQLVVRPMMYLALSYDHRIVDGREAVSFLVTIKECLEDPARLLLQI